MFAIAAVLTFLALSVPALGQSCQGGLVLKSTAVERQGKLQRYKKCCKTQQNLMYNYFKNRGKVDATCCPKSTLFVSRDGRCASKCPQAGSKFVAFPMRARARLGPGTCCVGTGCTVTTRDGGRTYACTCNPAPSKTPTKSPVFALPPTVHSFLDYVNENVTVIEDRIEIIECFKNVVIVRPQSVTAEIFDKILNAQYFVATNSSEAARGDPNVKCVCSPLVRKRSSGGFMGYVTGPDGLDELWIEADQASYGDIAAATIIQKLGVGSPVMNETVEIALYDWCVPSTEESARRLFGLPDVPKCAKKWDPAMNGNKCPMHDTCPAEQKVAVGNPNRCYFCGNIAECVEPNFPLGDICNVISDDLFFINHREACCEHDMCFIYASSYTESVLCSLDFQNDIFVNCLKKFVPPAACVLSSIVIGVPVNLATLLEKAGNEDIGKQKYYENNNCDCKPIHGGYVATGEDTLEWVHVDGVGTDDRKYTLMAKCVCQGAAEIAFDCTTEDVKPGVQCAEGSRFSSTFCTVSVDGEPFCALNSPCAGLVTCFADDDCGPFERCIPNTCCKEKDGLGVDQFVSTCTPRGIYVLPPNSQGLLSAAEYGGELVAVSPRNSMSDAACYSLDPDCVP